MVRELRFRVPHGMAKKKGGRTLEYILQVYCEGKGEESCGSLAHA